MIICEHCGGNCDPGEVVQGVCIECMEEERMTITKRSAIQKMLVSPFYQMTLREVVEGVGAD